MSSVEPASRKEQVDLSIVIVNHNTSRLLQQCLESVYQTAGELTFELFVVDNASSDGSIEMVRSQFPRVNLIANPVGLGFARAANLALAQSTGQYLLVAHPDVVFAPGAINEMHAFLAARPKIGAVGANLVYPDGHYNRCANKKSSMRQELVEFAYSMFRTPLKLWPWLQQRVDQERGAYYWDHQATSESDLIWNACMMFKREVYEAIGGFCEDFFIWFADTDWCYRAKSAGWQLYYLLNAKVIHYEKQSNQFLTNDLVRYKIRPALAQSAVNKDRYVLLKRHYSPFYLWVRKTIDFVSLWGTYLKLVALRVFVPARYRSTLDWTR